MSRPLAQLVVLAFLASICAAVWVASYALAPSTKLTFAVLDVGQGDALYIESPTGVQVLIDGGPDSAVLRELPKVMPAFDRSLDAVIATHPDSDHIGGLPDVMRRYEVSTFIEPGISKRTATYASLLHEVKEEGAAHHLARRGMLLNLGSGAYLQILYPDQDVSNLSDDETNEGGIVARLIYGEASVLLTADVPKFVEYRVTQLDGPTLESDILKIAHHGSRTSTSDILLQYSKPSLAVMSLGQNNRYGHPHQEVLDTLARFGVPFLRTDEEGTMVFESQGETFERVE